jgi:hypothetical protein
MYALTSLLLRDLYYPVAVQVCGWVTEIDGIWRAQGVLGMRIWVGEEGGGADAVL